MTSKIVAIIPLAIALTACGTVEADERGVFVNFGDVTGPVEPGLHSYNPFTTDLETLSIAAQKWDEKTSAYTADFQNADIQFTVGYQLRPQSVKRVWIEARDQWADRFIPQASYSAIKQVIGKTTATQLIQNRAATETAIRNALAASLSKRGIIVSDFSIRDIAFSAAFEKAVERKQVAVENAQAAKNQTVEIEEKAKQKIIVAEADAKAMQIKSQALSKNPGLAQYEAVQKWDGVLPANMYGGGAIPFIGVK